ncbi:MAG TPA: N-acetylneuraminate synthase family protein [Blastocatellia bacterium]|nr:N-acetylneuraminate synthase family protein [Blastocatellia bacterium]
MIPDNRVFIIGEVAQSHDGSLGMAHAFIDLIAGAGADAVKFQTHIAAAESTPSEPWRVKFSLQDESRYDYWKRMEFTEEQWAGLKRHCDDRGVAFLSSPFSVEAVELLTRIGVAAWKIASGEVTSGPMFERITETRLPVLLSTGMSPISEIDSAVEKVKSRGLPLTVMQCTSMYPTPAERVGLNMIPWFKQRYGCAVGLSDHSGEIYAGLAAATLGASVIEVHATFSREMFGPDVPVSLTGTALAQLVTGVRAIEKMLANPVDKDSVAAELSDMRRMFNKSVVARTDLASGTILKREHLTAKKPGTGIPASKLEDLIGRQLCRPVFKDEILKQEDIA